MMPSACRNLAARLLQEYVGRVELVRRGRTTARAGRGCYFVVRGSVVSLSLSSTSVARAHSGLSCCSAPASTIRRCALMMPTRLRAFARS